RSPQMIGTIIEEAPTGKPGWRSQFFDRKIGGARRDRTDDILLAKQALSQLSYGPTAVTQTYGRDRVCFSSGPFEHSSHGLRVSNRSTGTICPTGRLEDGGPG